MIYWSQLNAGCLIPSPNERGPLVKIFRVRNSSLAKSLKNDSGFTLIELLVVIIILGILASITIVSVSTARSNAVERACQTDAVNIRQALDQYFIDNAGTFPSATGTNSYYTAANLSALIPNSATAPTNKFYIRTLPPLRGDVAGEDYYLQVNVTQTSTVVSSVNTIQGYTTTTGSTATPSTAITACVIP